MFSWFGLKLACWIGVNLREGREGKVGKGGRVFFFVRGDWKNVGQGRETERERFVTLLFFFFSCKTTENSLPAFLHFAPA